MVHLAYFPECLRNYASLNRIRRMQRLTSFEVSRKFSTHGDAALHEPVMITHYRRPRAVLLNVDLFRELLDAAVSKKDLPSESLQQRLRTIATALDRKSKRRD
jgi:PHD/YefM family antitoxin component YafN of YafNO toxin-antitoxin module